MGGDSVVNVTDENFEAEVINCAIPVVVDLWAPWCGPCKMLGPIIEELAGDFAGTIKVAKLNVDGSPLTAAKYGVTSIPTTLFVKNGAVVDSYVGLLAKGPLKQKFESLLG